MCLSSCMAETLLHPSGPRVCDGECFCAQFCTLKFITSQGKRHSDQKWHLMHVLLTHGHRYHHW